MIYEVVGKYDAFTIGNMGMLSKIKSEIILLLSHQKGDSSSGC
jgi:hypothetical protein